MCDCIKQVNAKLAERNTQLGMCFRAEDTHMIHELLIVTEKIDKSKKARALLVPASCCPFCGECWVRAGNRGV